MIRVVVDHGGLRPGAVKALRAALSRVARAARLGALEVTVVLTGDDEIAALNGAWRGKPRPTDVLSFAAWEGEPVPGAEHLLGDVVISVDTAKRQAEAYGHGLDEEVSVLFAHGLLHLFGLDHERGPDEARLQAEQEMTILAAAGIDPSLALSGRGLR